jgi:DNA (cytosine-5)-methyltransferase 1
MALHPIHGIALCAGVGMLDEGLRAGLEYLGLEYRPAAYVEREAPAASQLVALMEAGALHPAPIYSDLCTFDGRPWRGKVDCVSSGFPCQPHSVAGKREGLEDERWIWPDIARIICEVEPRIVWLENVRGLVSTGGLEHVLFDLARLGFDAEWQIVSAAEVGASHQRERVFILAWRVGALGHAGHDAGNAEHRQQSNGTASWTRQSSEDCDGQMADSESDGIRGLSECEPGQERNQQKRSNDIDGCSEELADSAQLGRREGRPEPAGQQGRPDAAECGGAVADAESACVDMGHSECARRAQTGSGLAFYSGRQSEPGCCDMADPSSPRHEGREQPGTFIADGRTDGRTDSPYRSTSEFCDVPLFAPGPNDERWTDIISSFPHLAPAVDGKLNANFAEWLMGWPIGWTAGQSRADRLRAIGNGVCPLQAAVAFLTLYSRSGRMIHEKNM